jgi:hypothetical protein
MTKKLFLLTSLLLAFGVVALAADITGKWTAEVPGRQGNAQETTFTFKQDGSALTGSMTGGRGGDVNISDGKVEGDTVSFKVTRERQGQAMTQSYTGKVSGSEIKFKREGGRGEPIEFTAKKAN